MKSSYIVFALLTIGVLITLYLFMQKQSKTKTTITKEKFTELVEAEKEDEQDTTLNLHTLSGSFMSERAEFLLSDQNLANMDPEPIKQEYDRVMNVVAEARDKRNTLMADIETAKNRIDELISTNGDLASEISVLNRDLATVESEIMFLSGCSGSGEGDYGITDCTGEFLFDSDKVKALQQTVDASVDATISNIRALLRNDVQGDIRLSQWSMDDLPSTEEIDEVLQTVQGLKKTYRVFFDSMENIQTLVSSPELKHDASNVGTVDSHIEKAKQSCEEQTYECWIKNESYDPNLAGGSPLYAKQTFTMVYEPSNWPDDVCVRNPDVVCGPDPAFDCSAFSKECHNIDPDDPTNVLTETSRYVLSKDHMTCDLPIPDSFGDSCNNDFASFNTKAQNNCTSDDVEAAYDCYKYNIGTSHVKNANNEIVLQGMNEPVVSHTKIAGSKARVWTDGAGEDEKGVCSLNQSCMTQQETQNVVDCLGPADNHVCFETKEMAQGNSKIKVNTRTYKKKYQLGSWDDATERWNTGSCLTVPRDNECLTKSQADGLTSENWRCYQVTDEGDSVQVNSPANSRWRKYLDSDGAVRTNENCLKKAETDCYIRNQFQCYEINASGESVGRDEIFNKYIDYTQPVGNRCMTRPDCVSAEDSCLGHNQKTCYEGNDTFPNKSYDEETDTCSTRAVCVEADEHSCTTTNQWNCHQIQGDRSGYSVIANKQNKVFDADAETKCLQRNITEGESCMTLAEAECLTTDAGQCFNISSGSPVKIDGRFNKIYDPDARTQCSFDTECMLLDEAACITENQYQCYDVDYTKMTHSKLDGVMNKSFNRNTRTCSVSADCMGKEEAEYLTTNQWECYNADGTRFKNQAMYRNYDRTTGEKSLTPFCYKQAEVEAKNECEKNNFDCWKLNAASDYAENKNVKNSVFTLSADTGTQDYANTTQFQGHCATDADCKKYDEVSQTLATKCDVGNASVCYSATGDILAEDTMTGFNTKSRRINEVKNTSISCEKRDDSECLQPASLCGSQTVKCFTAPDYSDTTTDNHFYSASSSYTTESKIPNSDNTKCIKPSDCVTKPYCSYMDVYTDNATTFDFADIGKKSCSDNTIDDKVQYKWRLESSSTASVENPGESTVNSANWTNVTGLTPPLSNSNCVRVESMVTGTAAEKVVTDELCPCVANEDYESVWKWNTSTESYASLADLKADVCKNTCSNTDTPITKTRSKKSDSKCDGENNLFDDEVTSVNCFGEPTCDCVQSTAYDTKYFDEKDTSYTGNGGTGYSSVAALEFATSTQCDRKPRTALKVLVKKSKDSGGNCVGDDFIPVDVPKNDDSLQYVAMHKGCDCDVKDLTTSNPDYTTRYFFNEGDNGTVGYDTLDELVKAKCDSFTCERNKPYGKYMSKISTNQCSGPTYIRDSVKTSEGGNLLTTDACHESTCACSDANGDYKTRYYRLGEGEADLPGADDEGHKTVAEAVSSDCTAQVCPTGKIYSVDRKFNTDCSGGPLFKNKTLVETEDYTDTCMAQNCSCSTVNDYEDVKYYRSNTRTGTGYSENDLLSMCDASLDCGGLTTVFGKQAKKEGVLCADSDIENTKELDCRAICSCDTSNTSSDYGPKLYYRDEARTGQSYADMEALEASCNTSTDCDGTVTVYTKRARRETAFCGTEDQLGTEQLDCSSLCDCETSEQSDATAYVKTADDVAVEYATNDKLKESSCSLQGACNATYSGFTKHTKRPGAFCREGNYYQPLSAQTCSPLCKCNTAGDDYSGFKYHISGDTTNFYSDKEGTQGIQSSQCNASIHCSNPTSVPIKKTKTKTNSSCGGPTTITENDTMDCSAVCLRASEYKTFRFTGGPQEWIAPKTEIVQLKLLGGGGGRMSDGTTPGVGGYITINARVQKGVAYEVVVGGKGIDVGYRGGGGGGGGTGFRRKNGPWMVIAGGGGGGSGYGNGKGGFGPNTGRGGDGGKPPTYNGSNGVVNVGGTGGTISSPGGIPASHYIRTEEQRRPPTPSTGKNGGNGAHERGHNTQAYGIGMGGRGGLHDEDYGGGGGGGGWFGGGGGAIHTEGHAGGGGGGSTYFDSSLVLSNTVSSERLTSSDRNGFLTISA